MALAPTFQYQRELALQEGVVSVEYSDTRETLVTVTCQPIVTTLLVVSTGTTLLESPCRSTCSTPLTTAMAALVVTSSPLTSTLTLLVEASCPPPPARSVWKATPLQLVDNASPEKFVYTAKSCTGSQTSASAGP